jgi:hypothetical protein
MGDGQRLFPAGRSGQLDDRVRRLEQGLPNRLMSVLLLLSVSRMVVEASSQLVIGDVNCLPRFRVALERLQDG